MKKTSRKFKNQVNNDVSSENIFELVKEKEENAHWDVYAFMYSLPLFLILMELAISIFCIYGLKINDIFKLNPNHLFLFTFGLVVVLGVVPISILAKRITKWQTYANLRRELEHN